MVMAVVLGSMNRLHLLHASPFHRQLLGECFFSSSSFSHSELVKTSKLSHC